MSKFGIIFWFSMALIIGCGRYEVNIPDPNAGNSTNTSTNTSTSTKKVEDKEDKRATKPESVTGSASNAPVVDSTVQVDVKVVVKVDVKSDTRVKIPTEEGDLLNVYKTDGSDCKSSGRFSKFGNQLFFRWENTSYLRLYNDNSCWPDSTDIFLELKQKLTVCQKDLKGKLICNMLWKIETDPTTAHKTIYEYLDNFK